MHNPQAIITTSYDPSESLRTRAYDVAFDLQMPYVKRDHYSLDMLRQQHEVEDIVLVTMKKIEWHRTQETTLFFHPGMAFVRAKRLQHEQVDPLLEASGFQPGDRVLDCTAGLGSDAIVFAFAGQANTQVVALETNFPLFYVVQRGLKEYDSGWAAFNSAMRFIEIKCQHHHEFLRSLPDQSFDIVYFDPMFRSPIHASSGLSVIRSYANNESLRKETIVEAKRVARKKIILKERWGGGEFERLGFSIFPRKRNSAVYGVINI